MSPAVSTPHDSTLAVPCPCAAHSWRLRLRVRACSCWARPLFPLTPPALPCSCRMLCKSCNECEVEPRSPDRGCLLRPRLPPQRFPRRGHGQGWRTRHP
eukprot:4010111-Karenia_brevis.AAC.1